MISKPLDQLCINTIRTLAMDGVQKAKSGHPGMPMGMAPVAYVLWTKHLNHNPANMHWQNRDRFILSGGHGSMLLYSLLHLTGYKVTLDDLKSFRQLGSKTPGHPEYGHTDGVEVTTGPLGQGFTNGVGMAIAQKYLAARYNKPEFKVVDYHIYATLGDGDLMEGITAEAASLAGHLKLDNLIYFYDDNHISIDGSTELAFTEDRAKRFEAYEWFVQKVKDGNDLIAIDKAIQRAKKEKGRPSIIMVRTHIAFGSPNKHDTAEAHGSPLGEEEIKLTKEFYGWDPEKQFYIPEKALAQFRKAIEIGKKKELKWNEKISEYKHKFPELAAELENIRQGNFGEAWKKALPTFTDAMATREASGKTLNAIFPFLPSMIGGSADLTPSNNTFVKNMGEFQSKSRGGRYIRYGVREHAMGAIMNGMALTDGIIPYGGTFFVFSDYMRGSIRLACIMGIRPIYVFTHDSIGVGEDGPTHEPVEQLAALRCIPNMISLRPADANETVAAWKFAIEHKENPVALLLTRQKLPTIDRTKYPSADNLVKGAYVLVENSSTPDLILIGTGSEVQLALGAYEQLVKEGVKARMVSMPSWELFERQTKEYRDSVLPPNIKKRIAVEAAVSMGWEKYIGDAGRFVGMHSFGASAPVDAVFKHFGFTVENVVKAAKEIL
ncbi:MAG: transketolase [Bacteroidota bacterium]|jgi:transketolase